jgi:hypothetical protein
MFVKDMLCIIMSAVRIHRQLQLVAQDGHTASGVLYGADSHHEVISGKRLPDTNLCDTVNLIV